MSRNTAVKKYGKQAKRSKAERLFAELPQSPLRPKREPNTKEDSISLITEQVSSINIDEKAAAKPKAQPAIKDINSIHEKTIEIIDVEEDTNLKVPEEDTPKAEEPISHEPSYEDDSAEFEKLLEAQIASEAAVQETQLGTLTWDDVCPAGDQIEKIAEASYAEVYRVSNDRGTSIIKVIRLPSPIKPQTKAQIRSGLVDEEPHPEEDIQGELQISEWLADIPGFVVYKERYVVQGKTTKQLLETHQSFQKKMKRQDPDRAQFYPSPSRYLDETRFLVVELGDAGTSLEDWKLTSESQLWDILFLQAIALARAEDLVMFEHRDLHEGNLCIRQVKPPREMGPSSGGFFGFSGLDITILDYGLSRGEDLSIDDAKPVAFDFERDLSLFTSTHAAQCKVYRQMRSFLLRADRTCLPPEAHDTPYAKGVDGPLSWDAFAPYTNVLWLAYLYEYLTSHFKGEKKELARFKKETREMWKYLDPNAGEDVPCFGCAADVVCFAVEAGWIRQDQLNGAEESLIEREDSIIGIREEIKDITQERTPIRRSTRKR
ncbi:HASPIN protein kinase [Fusarium austroafricanum]|uniref:non-specific serine/threonine protein kinase n=1 Tax=Fusarium austroafricanum TaxID=2364996 RepID=A0A8H4KDW7_9HYPO|nr:HASPIN protein kinase [Fusarium austroafricanum]